MIQPVTKIKTVARVINSNLVRLPNGGYEIFVDLEAMDCCGDIGEIGTYHHAQDILQAWEILKPLRAGTIHYVEGDFRFGIGIIDLMAPDYQPFNGDSEIVTDIFSRHSSRKVQPDISRSICGCIKDIVIEKTNAGDAAIITLAERDDFVLVLFPDLFALYRSEILRGGYLEYHGITQYGYETEHFCATMIMVESIEIPILPDEKEGIDHEQ